MCSSLSVPTLHASFPVTRFATAMGYRNYVEELIRCSVYDRERKTPEDEVTQVVVGSRAEFRILKQDVDDSLDLVAEDAAETRHSCLVEGRCFVQFQFRFRMELVLHRPRRARTL